MKPVAISANGPLSSNGPYGGWEFVVFRNNTGNVVRNGLHEAGDTEGPILVSAPTNSSSPPSIIRLVSEEQVTE